MSAERLMVVTGQSGFVGSRLGRMLHGDLNDGNNLRVAPPNCELWSSEIALDLVDQDSIERYLGDICPDVVIHLAGQTFVPTSFENPAATFDVNLHGTLNLLTALKRRDFKGRFLYISSGDVYGQVPEEELPIVEARQIAPRNPYAVSKGAAELLCQQWNYTEAFEVMIARPFNHIGPGQRDSFVVAAMARQIARVKLGKQSAEIQVGDVDVSRDFLHVDDVIQAYFHILEKGRAGEIYNVCAGQDFVVRDLILKMADLACVAIELHQDPQRLRRSEQKRVIGNPAKLSRDTGWAPSISMDSALEDVLDYWIKKESHD